MGDIALVGIVGSGIMGIGLAEVAARAGFTVTVVARRADRGGAARAAVAARLDHDVARDRLSAAERDETLSRVTATHDLDPLADCDLVIESVVEDLDVKKALFTELDQVVPSPTPILATNTSTLPVVELAVETERPERVCGIHFFNPAPLMGARRDRAAAHRVRRHDRVGQAFAAACGKDAVEVQDRAGFIVNALLFPYLNNAVRMLEHGTASMDDIDTAMKGGCNFPMGPFALLDLVGLDTSLAILDALYAEFRDPNYAAVPTLRRMVTAGPRPQVRQGFYDYRK